MKLTTKQKWIRGLFVLASLIILTALTSCVSQKRRNKICQTCPLKIETKTKDSTGATTVKKSLYDSLLNIHNHIGKTFIYTNCDSLVAALNKSKDTTIAATKDGVKGTISGKGGKIIFKCETDSLKEVVRLLKLELSTPHFKTIETIKEVPARCDKDHKTAFDGFTRWWFYITGVILVGFVVYRRFG